MVQESSGHQLNVTIYFKSSSPNSKRNQDETLNSDVEKEEGKPVLSATSRNGQTRKKKVASGSSSNCSSVENVVVDPSLEALGVFQDLHVLFQAYNKELFWSKLGSVEVRWSTRMTLCAGLCVYHKGGYCSVRLSEPLLKYRTPKEYRETLLHEMIHAYLFVTQNNRDRDGHGLEFRKHMERVNATTKLNITIFHGFHDEVNYYRTHVWRCEGPCRNLPPFYGFVKRAVNRPPGPSDRWYGRHQAVCGGRYAKISEEAAVPKQKDKRKISDQRDITTLLNPKKRDNKPLLDTERIGSNDPWWNHGKAPREGRGSVASSVVEGVIDVDADSLSDLTSLDDLETVEDDGDAALIAVPRIDSQTDEGRHFRSGSSPNSQSILKTVTSVGQDIVEASRNSNVKARPHIESQMALHQRKRLIPDHVLERYEERLKKQRPS